MQLFLDNLKTMFFIELISIYLIAFNIFQKLFLNGCFVQKNLYYLYYIYVIHCLINLFTSGSDTKNI